MDALGEIVIKIEGSVGAKKLTPAMVDIEEIREILSQAAVLLFPAEKRSQRPLISYEIEEGSVLHKFRTVMQSVIGFGAVLSQISSQGQIDFLHERSAVAIEKLQHLAVEKNYVVTLSAHEGCLEIDRTTHYLRNAKLWVDAEFYLYGELTNAGGKNSPNIHLARKISAPFGFQRTRITCEVPIKISFTKSSESEPPVSRTCKPSKWIAIR